MGIIPDLIYNDTVLYSKFSHSILREVNRRKIEHSTYTNLHRIYYYEKHYTYPLQVVLTWYRLTTLIFKHRKTRE